jgi:hypothetical protein
MWAKLIIALAPVALKLIGLLAQLSKKDSSKETPVNLAQKLNEVAREVVAKSQTVQREALPTLITKAFTDKYPQFSARVVIVLARHWVKTHT